MQGKLVVESKKWSFKSVLVLIMTRIFREITRVLACVINLWFIEDSFSRCIHQAT